MGEYIDASESSKRIKWYNLLYKQFQNLEDFLGKQKLEKLTSDEEERFGYLRSNRIN